MERIRFPDHLFEQNFKLYKSGCSVRKLHFVGCEQERWRSAVSQKVVNADK